MNRFDGRKKRPSDDGASVSGVSVMLVLALFGGTSCKESTCAATPPSTDGVAPHFDKASDAPIEPRAVSPATLDAAVSANNAFAVELYGQFSAHATGNLLTSPLSVSLALSMAYAGAAGQTATEIATAVHFSGDPDAIAEGEGALGQVLASRGASALAAANQAGDCASSGEYQLQIVNSVWGEKTYPWERPFLGTLARDYATGVAVEDFIGAPDRALAAINGWVSAQTNDTINDLLPAGAIDQGTRMVLVNAIHMKLPWVTAFDPAKTAPGSFTKTDRSVVSTPFMHVNAMFAYGDDGMTQTVALPLSGNQIAIVISMPYGGVSLATYEATLTASSPALTVPASSTQMDLSLPRVAFTSPAFSLAAALQGLGMHQAFDPINADFTGMCASPPDGGKLSIHDVLQKAMVEMKETGVEAAAATAVVACNCAASVEVRSVVIDHPYVVSIVDVPTGAILFLGHIEDPTDSGGR